MTTHRLFRGSIATRISIVGSAGLAVVLLGICALMSVLVTVRARQQIVTWAGDKTQSLADSAEAFDMTSRVTVGRLFTVFKQDFDSSFVHDNATGDLQNSGTSLKDNFTAVDKFHQFTGGVATVFSRKGDGFARLTTSVPARSSARSSSAST